MLDDAPLQFKGKYCIQSANSIFWHLNPSDRKTKLLKVTKSKSGHALYPGAGHLAKDPLTRLMLHSSLTGRLAGYWVAK